MEAETKELEAALTELEALTKKGARKPDRYDARAVLVPLGELLLGAGAGSTEALIERTRRIGEALAEPWTDAIHAELSLAAAEHVHAVDPRYLDHPNYDFAYTKRARERLEARLVAASELDLELPASLRSGVALADERLKPYLDANG